MDCATSAASPAVWAMAVCSSVAAPPKARPQTATAAYTRAGASAATPSISVDKANSAMLASVSARRWRSISTPVIQMPSTEVAPNTSSTRSVRAAMPATARKGAM